MMSVEAVFAATPAAAAGPDAAVVFAFEDVFAGWPAGFGEGVGVHSRLGGGLRNG
jgi:hypothetical protein